MSHTAQKILAMPVPEGTLGVFFMGQAGVILKSPSGQLLGVDLYLSDCCQRYFGFKRLMPQLLLPGELELDALVTSHAHYDHFDVDSVPMLLSNSRTHLYAAADCVQECQRLGIPVGKYTVLKKQQEQSAGDFTILPVDCDHGELAPDALGLYIRCGEKTVYLAGDTCFREDIALQMKQLPITLAIAPINGAFGNMNSEDAAKFFRILDPECCMPCHYWNFAQHQGDPNAFIQIMETENPRQAYVLMCPGEGMLI